VGYWHVNYCDNWEVVSVNGSDRGVSVALDDEVEGMVGEPDIVRSRPFVR